MVQDGEPVGLDGVRVEFDDEGVVSDAAVMVVATLAARLGIEALAAQLVRLRGDRPGAANAGRKVMAILYAMVLGADSIDDCGVLRAGRTRRLLGGWLPSRRCGRVAPTVAGLDGLDGAAQLLSEKARAHDAKRERDRPPLEVLALAHQDLVHVRRSVGPRREGAGVAGLPPHVLESVVFRTTRLGSDQS